MLESQRVGFPTRFLLCYILTSYQVFLLTDESTVRQYKSDLTDEIEPQINELIDRAEKGLKALIRKENLIQAKVSRLILTHQVFTELVDALG